MKKITMLCIFMLTLFSTLSATSPQNISKDLPFLSKSFTTTLFDTVPSSHVTIVSLDYSGYVTFNTPPSPIYGTLQVIPYNTISRNLFTGYTNITFNDNSTLPFYVRIYTSEWSVWWEVTEDGFQIPNYYLSESFPVTIKIGTNLSLLF